MVAKDAKTPFVIARLISKTFLSKNVSNCFKDYEDDASWQTCTQSKCPFLTNCIFGCDSDECILECVRQFKKVHEDCPCEVSTFEIFIFMICFWHH